MRFRRSAAVITAAFLTGSSLFVGPAQASPSMETDRWAPALLSADPLYDGTVIRRHYTDGVTVVASAGAQVIFKGSEVPTTTADGRRVYDRAVRVVEPVRTKATLEKAAAAYSRAGRSVYADALAAGFSEAEARAEAGTQSTIQSEPPILFSGCVHSEDQEPDPEFEWSGCWKHYTAIEFDPGVMYVAGSATAHGWGTNVLNGKELERGYTQIIWHSSHGGPQPEIIDASPAASIPGTNCATFTVGLVKVIILSYAVPLCDDGWDVTWNPSVHKVDWHGSSTGGESDTRAASGATTARSVFHNNTFSAGLIYEIGWTYICFFC